MRPRTIATLSALALSALYAPCQAGLESVGGWRANSATVLYQDNNVNIVDQESWTYPHSGELQQDAEASQPLPHGSYCQSGSQQDTVVTDGSYGQSILKGRGSVSTNEDTFQSHDYRATSDSTSLVQFTSAHPFQWILDAEVELNYAGNPDGNSQITLGLIESIPYRRNQRKWGYQFSCSNPDENYSQYNRISGRLPAGTYWFCVSARARINDEKADKPVPEDSAAFAEYFVDLRIKQYPTVDVSEYLNTGKWDRVTDTLLDLGKQDPAWQSDLDGNGKIDVDDVISALESVLDKEAASDADTAKAKDEMPAAGAAGSSSKAAAGKPAAGKK